MVKWGICLSSITRRGSHIFYIFVPFAPLVTIFCVSFFTILFFWKLINQLINFIIKNNPCKFEAFLWDLKKGNLAKPPIEKGITDKTCKINLFCYIRTLINHWLQIPTPIIMWQFFATRWLSAKVVIAVTFIYL